MREYKDTLAELSKMWDEMLVSSVKNNSRNVLIPLRR
jgi:hypothetical protein